MKQVHLKGNEVSETVVKKIKSKSKTLHDLATRYLELRDERDAAAISAKNTSRKIMKKLGVQQQLALSEEEANEIERLSVSVFEGYEDKRTISYYVTKSVQPDWEYLENILTPQQLKRAKVVKHSTALKVT